MSRLFVKRRDVLKGMGAAGVVGCSGLDPSGPSGADLSSRFDTIVLCMMENRSFDHVFGSLSLLEGRDDVEGLRADMTNPDLAGVEHPITPSPWPCVDPDPPHGWGTSRVQMDGGSNLGFVRAYQQSYGEKAPPENVMGYLSRAQQPISYAVADRFAICNRWFSSVLSSTWPNRLYFHSATSVGIPNNSLPSGGAYSQRTLWDQLTDAGIDWGYYFTDLPTLALFGRYGERANFIEQFYADAAAGQLPRVCAVDAGAGYNDDHPPHHPLLGQVFLGSIIEALQRSPHWERCLFIVAYDEAGGFFDHVPPPTMPDDHAAEGFDQLGFRVPAFAVGPYVREGFASDVHFDHTSALRTVQEIYGLGQLTARDAATNPLWDLIDFDRLALGEPRPPIELPTIELTEEEIVAQCSSSGWARNTGQPELQEHVQRVAPGLDRTGELPQIARSMAEIAADLGVLRIR